MDGHALVGPYRLEGKLGEGGMGVVYRAMDTRLDRRVALKLLAPHLSSDSDAAERFAREARAAAAAEHTNICTIYDIGETPEGRRYIAMPLYEGRTVGQRIDDGPLDLATAVDIATQTARGLAAAHSRGITHRDIKPGNLFVTDDGTVKILDFGLARRVDQRTITDPGSTVGTAAYMSPEQVQGLPPDARTDIWSLGVVLHEMIAGTRPFRGDYPQAMVYAILNEDPPALTSLRSGLPIGIDAVVAKCLQKDPDHRYQHVDELPADLAAMTAGSAAGRDSAIGSTLPGSRHPASRRRGARLAIATGMPAMLLLGALAWWVVTRDPPVQPPDTMRLEMLLADGSRFENDRPSVAISRDGRFVAYASARDDTSRLYVRPVDSFDARALRGTEGAHLPFFSPDGSWIGYFTEEAIYRIAVSGGMPIMVTEVALGNLPFASATWSDDDRILYTLRTGELGVVTPEGRHLGTIGRGLPTDIELYRFPHVLPGGTQVLAARERWTSSSALVALSVDDGSEKVLLESASHPRYIPGGQLVYSIDTDLYAAPFDPVRLQLTGPGRRVLQGVQRGALGGSYYDVSDTGTLVYTPLGVDTIERTLVWMDSTGRITPLPLGDEAAYTPRVSPDGRYIAYQRRAPNDEHVYVYDTERESVSKLTDSSSDVVEYWFTWAPDSRTLVFNSSLGTAGRVDLFSKSISETGSGRRIVRDDVNTAPAEVSPDGRYLLYIRASTLENGTGIDIWAQDRETGQAAPVVATEANEFHPALSPDGRWLAYASDRSGRWQTYVQPWPEGGGVQQVSHDDVGGGEPMWSPDGRTLYFRSRSGRRLYATSVSYTALASGERSLSLGRTRLETEGPFFSCSEYGRSYDMTRDGRIIFVRDAVPGAEMGQLNVISGWTGEVSRILREDA